MSNHLFTPPSYDNVLVEEPVKKHLKAYLKGNTLPHALLFTGEDGGEALPLALAFARHILCLHPSDDAPCGICTSCKQIDDLSHPDLYPIFPIIKVGDKDSVSGDVMEQFRDLLLNQSRISYEDWKERQKSGNKQLSILVAEAEKLLQYTALKSFQSAHQVILIWMPEQMRTETANKLLKLLEEPPEGVVFLAVSHQPQHLLPTIISRFQRIIVPPISEERLIHYLTEERSIPLPEATELGHLAKGNLHRAEAMHSNGLLSSSIEEALHILELPIARDPRLYQKEAEVIAKMGRPQVLDLLGDITRILREILAFSQNTPQIVYTPSVYSDRLRNLGEYLSLDSIMELIDDLRAASLEIRQNANIKIVFFDLFLHISVIYARQR